MMVSEFWAQCVKVIREPVFQDELLAPVWQDEIDLLGSDWRHF